jgi:hypothetical protein
VLHLGQRGNEAWTRRNFARHPGAQNSHRSLAPRKAAAAGSREKHSNNNMGRTGSPQSGQGRQKRVEQRTHAELGQVLIHAEGGGGLDVGGGVAVVHLPPRQLRRADHGSHDLWGWVGRR